MAESATTDTAVLSQPALEAWGRRVGADLAAGEIGPPLVIVLRGPLGAGKSVLARAIARGAGVTRPMPSPTYNLVFGYDGDGVRVQHLDLYRLEHPDDVWELGWQELGEGDQLVLIEWPERAEELLPPARWEVRLSFLEGVGEDAGAGEGASAGEDAAFLRRMVARRVGGAPDVPPLASPSSVGGGP